ncbi:acyl carrier protein [Sphingobacterium sp. SYP-B4668]|uniref:acyl carrier protein n=1 Tax=Sphingobacterium sp. SYP-B4668 TaxID=2996035 RepID=UPI0022DD82D2|nr:acyl carrier protein [Sphingobacterium sp. SYP-B4668]
MKRILMWMLTVIGILVLGCWAYLSYRESDSKHGLVHAQSHAVIEVSIDGMLGAIARNAMLNPGTYYKGRRSIESDSAGLGIAQSGWDFPANVFLFSLEEMPHRFFSVQSIGNSKQFTQYIKQRFSKSNDTLIQGQKLQYGLSEDSRFAVLFDEQQFVLSLGVDQKLHWEIMANWLAGNEKALVEVSSLSLDGFKNGKSDITYLNMVDQTRLAVTFRNGRIDFEGDVISPSIIGVRDATARQLDTTSVLYGWLNADLRPLFKGYSETLLKYDVNADSLAKYYGGYVDVQWKSDLVKQIDTIVTYDLDENFEMTEKMERREVEVPHLNLVVKASPHIAGYLPEKMFYKFKKSVSGDLIALNTGPQMIMEDKRAASPYYGYLYAKLDKALPILMPNREGIDWEKFQVLEIGMSRGVQGESVITGKCILRDATIHALYQLL